MLPDANDFPASSGQHPVVSPISLDGSRNLPLPPIAIAPGEGAVVGAAMPPAAVNEDGDASGAEYHDVLAV